MDVNTLDLRALGAHAPDQRKRLRQGGHAPDLGGYATGHGEHVPGPRARVTVSRARAVLTFLLAKTSSAACRIAERFDGGWGSARKGTITDAVPSGP